MSIVIEDILAGRYATEGMKRNWSPEGKVVAERRFWITVMRVQKALGIDIPDGVIEDYEAQVENVRLDSIAARERVLRHDVKARIEEFCDLAGHEHIHKGMTSRDVTDNVEQMLVRQSLEMVRDHLVALLRLMLSRATEWSDLVITGRSHNVPGQPITLGKRIANYGEELLVAFEELERLIESYPLRGMKGAMGTSQDMLDLLGGDTHLLHMMETTLATELDFSEVLNAVGQVYPRSLDYRVGSALVQVAAGPSSLATTLRLMAGFELASEGFKVGQVGSSAMPHKMNSRTCERINGFDTIIKGFASMLADLPGNQWQEGDVSCSVVRRVALPGAFFAIDGLIESAMTVMLEMGVYPAVIQRELDRYLPSLATTKVLMALTRADVGREVAHELIKEHALAATLAMRAGAPENDLLERLAADERVTLSSEELHALLGDPLEMTGDSQGQIERFHLKVARLVHDYPEGARYMSADIL